MTRARGAAPGAGWFLAFFLVSGFCGLVYETVWLRLAMGAFGVSAPYVSLFLSAFMGLLGLGSWLGGAWCRRRGPSAAAALRLYAAAELGLALCSRGVPALLERARALLAGAAWGSASYHAAAGGLTAAILLPAGLCLGATFPFAMAAWRRADPERAASSFSALYLANVLGAAAGTAAAAFALIELLGLRGTAALAGGLNAALAAAAFALSPRLSDAPPAARAAAPSAAAGDGALALLFATGFASMGMEVVWIREFTPYLGTSIYAFAAILAVYLLASFAGTAAYRRGAGPRRALHEDLAWLAIGALSLLPASAADASLPRALPGAVRVVLGLAPFCAATGFVTPALVDRWSRGDEARAGSAYAVNVLGCVLGPLAAGFLLIPRLPERLALGVLALPLLAAGAWTARRRAGAGPLLGRLGAPAVFLALSAPAALLPFVSRTYEEGAARLMSVAAVRRDFQASVAGGYHGGEPLLIVSGSDMTALTPITKAMAHLPLALLGRPPRRALVICFGMGTTFRSMVSWGIPTTAVELVPSVPKLFALFHADARRVLASPGARVVIDDGRRFLARDDGAYDAIAIDPAPPMEAAGTAFLYSRELYALARARLAPGGILQQWIPGDLEPAVVSAYVGAVLASFPHVRAFRSTDDWGWHVLASDAPIASASAAELAARLPPAAAADFVEWGPARDARAQFALLLSREVAPSSLLVPGVAPLADDRPINEYYLLRRSFGAAR